MHPFRYALTRGSMVLRAPEDDQGSDYDDAVDEVDDVEPDEPDDQDDPDEQDDDVNDLDEPDELAPAAPSRAGNRVAVATKIAAEAKARADKLEAELTAFRAQMDAAQQPPRETQQQLNARLAEMEPWERAETIARMTADNVQGQLNQIRWDAQESADRTSFDALCAREPAAAKLKDAVEERLALMRKSGTTVNRETLYTHMLGERARANVGRATGKAQRTATANRDRQASRPGNGRGDVAASDTRRGNTASAREKRLENQPL